MMEYEILIEKSELQHQVDLRTYYHAESEKRQNLDADLGETSHDDAELMEMFTHKAVNELVADISGRFKGISYRMDDNYISIKFESSDDTHGYLLPILKQAVTDYLANELMVQWLMVRKRQWSDPYISMRNELRRRVTELLVSFCNKKIRRRSTNLAGI